MDLGLLKLD